MVDLVYGPLNKNLFTQTIELVTKCLIYAPNEVKLFSKQENNDGNSFSPSDLHAKVGHIEVNLSQLFAKANLSHVQFSEADSNALLKNLNTIYYYHTFEHDKTGPITEAEQNAVTNYTGSGYYNINNFLYNDAKVNPFYVDVKEVFLNTVFLSSALNKITPDGDHFKTYRGEHSTPYEEILERISLVQQGGGVTDQVAFQSTSSDKSVSECFKGNCLIIFDDAYGKSVASYSYFPSEQEYLLSPGKILWTSYEYKDGCHTFHAQVVNPLVPGADTAKEQDYSLFDQLLDFAKKHGVSDNFVTDHLKAELKETHHKEINFDNLNKFNLPLGFQGSEANTTNHPLKINDCLSFNNDAIPGLDTPEAKILPQGVLPVCNQQAPDISACLLANVQIMPAIHLETAVVA